MHHTSSRPNAGISGSPPAGGPSGRLDSRPADQLKLCVGGSARPDATQSARSLTDRASDYGSEGWGFESLRARHGIKPIAIPIHLPHVCRT